MTRHVKEIIQYGSAIWVILLGSGLSIASFIISSGHIHDSVLWFYAQCLMWAGMIFGFGMYVKGEFKNIKNELNTRLDNKLKDKVDDTDNKKL